MTIDDFDRQQDNPRRLITCCFNSIKCLLSSLLVVAVYIRVRDDGEGSALVDFIDKIGIGHGDFPA